MNCELKDVVKDLPDNPKLIPLKSIQDLGYQFTKNKVVFKCGSKTYCLLEMKENDSKKLASFSLLYSDSEKTVVVLPKPFTFYAH